MSPISIMHLIRKPNHIFYRRVASKQGQINDQPFFICHSFFFCTAFFPLKSELKYIIIRLPYDISNDIIQSYQFSRRILPLLPLIASNFNRHYSVLLDLRHSIIEVNEPNTQDVNRAFPNLIPTETLVFSLYLNKFANSLFTYLKGRNFCNHKLLQNLFL